MGQSRSKPTGAQPSSDEVQTIQEGASSPQNDLVRQIKNSAMSRLTGLSGMRMAGEKLSPIQPMTSMAEESAAMKYSPETPTKTPSSQYLSYSSSPERRKGT